ncbi:MAG: magnetosome protein MamC [Magnetococcales bacterium]|nr:magnetosome protein MamC [Magnetococcales bacterium]
MSFNLAMFLAKSVGGVGVLGGIVGGSAALAKNIKKKREGTISNREIAVDTGKEAVGAGVATAFSAFSAGLVGGGLAVSLGTAFVAAAAGKFAWDYGVDFIEARMEEDKQTELDSEMDEVFSASSIPFIKPETDVETIKGSVENKQDVDSAENSKSMKFIPAQKTEPADDEDRTELI